MTPAPGRSIPSVSSPSDHSRGRGEADRLPLSPRHPLARLDQDQALPDPQLRATQVRSLPRSGDRIEGASSSAFARMRGWQWRVLWNRDTAETWSSNSLGSLAPTTDRSRWLVPQLCTRTI